MDTKVHIVIPHYNNWPLTHQRLFEIMKLFGKKVSTVLVVDDCSTDSMTEGGLRWWAEMRTKTGFPVEALVLDENVNFTKSSNIGLKHITGKCEPQDIVVLLSNDVKIMTDFIGQMTEILRQPKTLVGGVLYTHDTGWNTFDGKTFPYLEGWLLATTAESWKELGYFDEIYSPCIFEDVDLSTKALRKEYWLASLKDSGLEHISGQSIHYNESRHELTRVNQTKFKEKWIK